MQRRTPEIIIGAVLAIAIFAMGTMVFEVFHNTLPEKTTTDWLLVVSNIVLVVFVFLQLRDARRSSERQLRAYIYVVKTNIQPSDAGWTIKFRIKNFGQTPAHKARIHYTTQIVPWVEGVPVKIDLPEDADNLGSIGPISDSFDFESTPEGSVSAGDLNDRISAIFLVGRIVYDTVFASGLTTNFRFYVGGDAGWDGPGEMTADAEGNDAT